MSDKDQQKYLINLLDKYIDDKQQEINYICSHLHIAGVQSLGPSRILSYENKHKLMKLCGFNTETVKWKLLYRGTIDGFAAKDFHQKCDGIQKTLTIIKTNEK